MQLGSSCQTAPPSTLQLKFHNEGFIPLVQSSFSSKAIPPPPLVTDTQRAHNDHILSRGQNFRKNGWRRGECLVVKGLQINSNFHGGNVTGPPAAIVRRLKILVCPDFQGPQMCELTKPTRSLPPRKVLLPMHSEAPSPASHFHRGRNQCSESYLPEVTELAPGPGLEISYLHHGIMNADMHHN